MFRLAVSRAAAIARPMVAVRPALAVRFYSEGPSFTPAEVEARVLDLLRSNSKVKAEKLALSAHLIKDLGLDSLDTVEVIMATEEEFNVHIPDESLENTNTVQDVINHVVSRLH